MERHSELKIRYDPEIGRYVKKQFILEKYMAKD